MNPDSLVVGVELPEYRASARMPADPMENKIHEDALARAMGFRGGLVPGVTVYALRFQMLNRGSGYGHQRYMKRGPEPPSMAAMWERALSALAGAMGAPE